ncbi:MAG: argininosuccinate lyase [Legionellales bacterium]|nr:argininosuccinate lyase [Legionellales bacterium]
MNTSDPKLWGGRFTKATHQQVDEYNASISFDYQLAEFDLLGSLAHVKMLAHCQIIDQASAIRITEGLQQLQHKLSQGALTFRIEDEDIHMNLERQLHELIGEDAGKLHTGRSRNDQVALDLHLYVRHHLLLIVEQLIQFNQTLLDQATQHIDTIMPGYTHLQRAEPIRFAHHLLAYVSMFGRDIDRLIGQWSRINYSPLGAGALAGSGVAVDRHYVAQQLGFDQIYSNSLDAVSDRDFVIEFLTNASLIMTHFSKLSEEIILWSSHEFSFIQLDDAFCTGSSMMPQKKNPDVAELARGKTGRVVGALMSLFTVLKGLPLAYNKDLQEDKQGLFDVVQTIEKTLAVYTPMLASMHVHTDRLSQTVRDDFSNATQIANYLAAKGIPFRQAHTITGQIILHCLEQNKLLSELSLKQYQTFSNQFSEDIFSELDIINVIESHQADGGTAKRSVQQQIQQAYDQLAQFQQWLTKHQPLLTLQL